jgi:hypothetical protein
LQLELFEQPEGFPKFFIVPAEGARQLLL